jgi:hypothetical protein
MKNSVLLASLLLIVSCKKAVPSQENKADSVIVSEQSSNALQVDSTNAKVKNDTLLQSVNTKSDENVSKQNGETVKLVDGEKLPSTLEFLVMKMISSIYLLKILMERFYASVNLL